MKVFGAAQEQQADYRVAAARKHSEEACASAEVGTDLAGMESEVTLHQKAAKGQPDMEGEMLDQSEG